METQNYFLRGIPADVWKAFKMHCLEKDTTVKDEIIRLITRTVKRRIVGHGDLRDVLRDSDE